MAQQLGKIKHFFLGTNTGQRFYSFYGQLGKEVSTRLFIIKGGPGTGKSTFMQKIGQEMLSRGFPVEFAHCSSDSNSLDGVLLPSLGIALVDGTSPHIVDPVYPGVVGEILNFGDFWDEKALREKKETILELTRLMSTCYSRVYSYLRAAAEIHREWSRTNRRLLRDDQLFTVSKELQEKIFNRQKPAPGTGKIRHFFASSLTPAGPVHFLENIFQEAEALYILEGALGHGQEEIVETLLHSAKSERWAVDVFHCALRPEKVEHLWFSGIRTGIVTSTPPHRYPASKGARVIELSRLQREDSLSTQAGEECRAVFNSLCAQAVAWLQKAKTFHGELEACYSPNMDFEGLDNLQQKILAKILAYAADNGTNPLSCH